MTADDVLQIARELQLEYAGQAEQEQSPTQQFVLVSKSLAMAEFIQRVHYKANGERG